MSTSDYMGIALAEAEAAAQEEDEAGDDGDAQED